MLSAVLGSVDGAALAALALDGADAVDLATVVLVVVAVPGVVAAGFGTGSVADPAPWRPRARSPHAAPWPRKHPPRRQRQRPRPQVPQTVRTQATRPRIRHRHRYRSNRATRHRRKARTRPSQRQPPPPRAATPARSGRQCPSAPIRSVCARVRAWAGSPQLKSGDLLPLCRKAHGIKERRFANRLFTAAISSNACVQPLFEFY